MDTNDSAANTLMDKVVEYRGLIIHLAVMFEDCIDRVITGHFLGNETSERKDEFRGAVLGRENFSLSAKCDLASFIVKNHYPELLKECPEFLSYSRKLVEIRNEFAHRKFDSTQFEGLQDLNLHLHHLSTENGKVKIKKTAITENAFYNNYMKVIDLAVNYAWRLEDIIYFKKILPASYYSD